MSDSKLSDQEKAEKLEVLVNQHIDGAKCPSGGEYHILVSGDSIKFYCTIDGHDTLSISASIESHMDAIQGILNNEYYLTEENKVTLDKFLGSSGTIDSSAIETGKLTTVISEVLQESFLLNDSSYWVLKYKYDSTTGKIVITEIYYSGNDIESYAIGDYLPCVKVVTTSSGKVTSTSGKAKVTTKTYTRTDGVTVTYKVVDPTKFTAA